jgi:hypothetical protein
VLLLGAGAVLGDGVAFGVSSRRAALPVFFFCSRLP